MLPLAGGHRPIVEQELPGGQQGDLLPGEGGQVSRQAAALLLVGAHQHHRAVQPPADTRGEVGPVHWSQTGHRRRRTARVQGVQQLLELEDAV